MATSTQPGVWAVPSMGQYDLLGAAWEMAPAWCAEGAARSLDQIGLCLILPSDSAACEALTDHFCQQR